MSRLPEHWVSFNTCHESSRGKKKLYWQKARLNNGLRPVYCERVIHDDRLFYSRYRFEQKSLLLQMHEFTHSWYGAINGGKSLCGRFEIRAHGSTFSAWTPVRTFPCTEMWADGKLVRRTANAVMAFNWMALKCGIQINKTGEIHEKNQQKSKRRVSEKRICVDAGIRCPA